MGRNSSHNDASELRSSICWFIAGVFTCWLILSSNPPGCSAASCSAVCTEVCGACRSELEVKNSLVRKLWSKLITQEQEAAAANGGLSDQQLPYAAVDQLMRRAAVHGDGVTPEEVKTALTQELPVNSKSDARMEYDGCDAHPQPSTKLASYLQSLDEERADELFERFKLPGDTRNEWLASRAPHGTSQETDHEELRSREWSQSEQLHQNGEGIIDADADELHGGTTARWDQQRKFHCIKQVASNSSVGGSEWAFLPC